MTLTNQQPKKTDLLTPKLQLVAWEMTQRCNLLCAHCRGSSTDKIYSNELTLDESYRLVDQILEVGNPILILTGGEPLSHPNFFEIARYAAGKGMRVVMGTNGTLITKEIAARLKEIPVARIAISLDFPNAEEQDEFRSKPGAFEEALAGLAYCRQVGIPTQINSTITKLNVHHLDRLLDLAFEVGAIAFHPFLLVPTGRGKALEALELPPEEYERTLNWIYDKQKELGDRMFFKPTDAPHYLRIMKQRSHGQEQPQVHGHPGQSGHPGGGHPGGSGHPTNAISRGCLAGLGFCFVSGQGKIKGCGYFDIEAGDVRENTFKEVWDNSPLFNQLRDLTNLKGKCGVCEYKRICGGCRARAYEATGDCLEAEPYCVYEPPAWKNIT